MSKPRILFVTLQFGVTFDELNIRLLAALRVRAAVQQVKSPGGLIQHLSRSPVPKAVLIADSGIADRRNNRALTKLVQYVKAGGTVVFAQFSSFIEPLSMNAMFKKSWNLPWTSGSYHQAMFSLNSALIGLDVQHLTREYGMKALHLQNVAIDTAVYLRTSESRIESAIFRRDHVMNFTETPVAFTAVGNGRLGYVGEGNNENDTINVICSMCLTKSDTSPKVPSVDSASSTRSTKTAGPSGQQASPRKRVIVLISLLKEPYMEMVCAQLYLGLRKNATVHEAECIDAANEFLSMSPPPDAVLVTDAAIQDRKHSALLTRLTEYMQKGGRVILGVQFSNQFKLDVAPAFFQRWGVPWTAGSYLRTTFVLNPAGIPAPLSAQALFPSYSMKTLHLKNVPREAAVYVPTTASRVESNVSAPTPITGARLTEYPAVFARVGEGFLGYVGDVNDEQPTIRLLIEMCGVKVMPGDLRKQRFTSSVSITPNGEMEAVEEEIAEIPLPAQRPREDEVTARAAERAAKWKVAQAGAEKLKEEGNEFFKQGENLKAAEKYREAAFLDGPRPGYMANLAAVLLRLERWNLAESAAKRALSYDSHNIKARYRRAVARKHLSEYDEALKDLHFILRLEPTNTAARTELKEIIDLRGGQEDDEADCDMPDVDGTSELAVGSESDDYLHEGNGIPCKFYNHDGCNRGDLCGYMHAPDDKSVRDELGRNVCVYWLIDSCRFGGDRCVYAHDRTYLPKKGWWNEDLQLELRRRSYREVSREIPFGISVPKFEGILVDLLVASTWKHDLWATVPYGERDSAGEYDDDDEDDEDLSFLKEIKERRDNFGFTRDDVDELLSYGVKPWDDDAWAVHHTINGY